MIVVADAGLGNIASVANMLEYLELDSEVRAKPGDLSGVSHLILPGVGSFDTGMRGLEKSGWASALADRPQGLRILGVCLGMQLLAVSSEEGSRSGLGLISAHFVRIDDSAVSVPHMGWNDIVAVRPSPLFPTSRERERYYFTHSYRAECDNQGVVLAVAQYGGEIVAAYGSGNVYGVQFHPEKSHVFGMALLRRFAES